MWEQKIVQGEYRVQRGKKVHKCKQKKSSQGKQKCKGNKGARGKQLQGWKKVQGGIKGARWKTGARENKKGEGD